MARFAVDKTILIMKGFTFLELMLCIFIASIGVCFAMPSIIRSYHHWEVRHAMRSWKALLQVAQTWALVHQETVYIVPHPNWNHVQAVTQEGKLLRHLTIEECITINWKGFPMGKKQIEFSALGLLAQENGHFTFCAKNHCITMTVSKSGIIHGF